MITVLLVWVLLSLVIAVVWAAAARREPRCEPVPIRLPESAVVSRSR